MICSITDGMMVGTTGCSRGKHEMAMSPKRAWADCLIGGSKCYILDQLAFIVKKKRKLMLHSR